MKRSIRVKLCGYDADNPFSYGRFILDILEKHYTVELSEDPEYVFFNEGSIDYLNYSGIRIFYTGENVHPNFNLCDYAISFDRLDFGDRHFRLPLYMVRRFYTKEEVERDHADFFDPNPFTQEELARKRGFCSFVYSNYLTDPTRNLFFNALSTYKKVDSGGRYLNNIGKPVISKLSFESQYKFSIAFENSSRDGYVTEKLPNALTARTIPIYYGSPSITEEFNPKRFINIHDYSNMEAAIARVREIDQDDAQYLSIVNEPWLSTINNPEKVLEDFEKFLRHIIDQPISKALRICINPARKQVLEEREAIANSVLTRRTYLKNIIVKLYQPLKYFSSIETAKQRFFQREFRKR